jgi:TPR repeat protein
VLAILLNVAAAGAAVAQNDVPKSYTEAMRWYEAGAKAGDTKAQFYLGVALEQVARGAPRSAGGPGLVREGGGRWARACALQAGGDAAERAGRAGQSSGGAPSV